MPRNKLNKPVLAVLLVVAAALVTVLVIRGPMDTRPPVPPPWPQPESPTIDGLATEETPEFDVEVATRVRGAQKRLEFTITERHGWAVEMVYVRARYGEIDPDTGEFVSDMQYPVEMLCRGFLDFGRPLVAETTLTNVELGQTDGQLGGPENWEAVIYDWKNVYKPKD